MSFAGFLSTIEGAFSSVTKRSLSSFNFIETGDGQKTLIGKDGSLCSIIRIDGVSRMMGAADLDALTRRLEISMASHFGRPGHALQVWFARDPDMSRQMTADLNRPAKRVADAVGLDLSDLFRERETFLANHLVWEGFYMALWTRLSILTKVELKAVGAETTPPPLWPAARDTQDIHRASRKLFDRHRAFVTSFAGELKNVNFRASILDNAEALQALRCSVYPDCLNSRWRPTLPGGKAPRREPLAPNDNSHFMWPRLEDQIFSKEAEVLSPRIVRIGSYLFSAVDMTIGPQELQPFDAMVRRMMQLNEYPWRVSFLLEGAGLGSVGFKNFMASIMAFSNSENRLISEAIKGLREQTSQGEVTTRLRVSFATWAPAGQMTLIEERASQLAKTIEGWGYCSVSSAIGDPVAGVMSSALGIDVRSTAPAGIAPLGDAIYLLPWNRDASPWSTGSVLFRTPDGRPWPYEPGSNLQDAFIDLVSAPPGKGKSVWMNTTNLAMCLSAAATSGSGGTQLPRIAIIDIGPSSSGLVSLIREALPPERRHEAQYLRLRMSREHAINPFDTQLGSRRPLYLERAFLVNFLTVLGTSVGAERPPEGLSDLAGAAVDELYEMFDDKSRNGDPRQYSPGESALVDEAIDRHAIDIVPAMTWWSLVDQLFEAGDLHAATVAQTYAVPRIEDLQTIIHKTQITDTFGESRTAQGESLLSVFQQKVSSALREYPILTLPTKFDTGDSRVVSLDLNDAAPRGGGPAEKQTALVYMLARFVLARDFYLSEDDVQYFSPLYLDHHRERIRRLRETPKRLVYDEFHRTRSSPAVRDQVIIDMREGRKWGVQLVLASQLLDDFDQDMVELASGIWIMGVGSERSAREAQDLFGLSDTATHAIAQKLNGPGPGGAPFMALLKLKSGQHEHLLLNTLGPQEIWAFSTTSRDTVLRNELYRELGATEARRRLAARFPGGSAEEEIRRRLSALVENNQDTEEARQGVIGILAKEMLERAPGS